MSTREAYLAFKDDLAIAGGRVERGLAGRLEIRCPWWATAGVERVCAKHKVVLGTPRHVLPRRP